jgi:hypothetical protein
MPDESSSLQELADYLEIVELANRYGRYADEGRFADQAEDIYTDDVVVELESGAITLQGIEAHNQNAAKSRDVYARTQHVITNVMVDRRGDRADVRTNLVATHIFDLAHPELYWIVKGFYVFEAARTPKGWRFSRRALYRTWEEDSREPAETRFKAPKIPAGKLGNRV